MLRSTGEPGQDLASGTWDAPGEGTRGPRIRCPRCAWQPSAHDRWQCRSECLHVWNTFDTGGVCPACGHAWADTQCLRCQEWSPHEAWYAADEPE